MRQLNEKQLDQFKSEGYVVVRGFLDPDTHIRPVLEEYELVLDRLARSLYAQGKISSLYMALPFAERLTKVYVESGEVHSQWFDFSLPQKDIREDTPFWFGPEVFKLLKCDALLDVAEQFVGPEVYSTPVQHIRIKPPESAIPETLDNRVIETPWHQDNGVLLEDADETIMLTVWFPLTPADGRDGVSESSSWKPSRRTLASLHPVERVRDTGPVIARQGGRSPSDDAGGCNLYGPADVSWLPPE